ncbi:MAG: leucine-rich repeat protein, partial [Thermoguttaceae bacterium]|nr:leucine-rich repeat protein [Thermoguttaceae bacterium]
MEQSGLPSDQDDPKAGRRVVPDGVAAIKQCFFEKLRELTSVYIPASVKTIEVDAFDDLRSLAEIVVDKDNARFRSIGGALFAKDRKTFLKYPQGMKKERYVVPDGVETIGRGA